MEEPCGIFGVSKVSCINLVVRYSASYPVFSQLSGIQPVIRYSASYPIFGKLSILSQLSGRLFGEISGMRIENSVQWIQWLWGRKFRVPVEEKEIDYEGYDFLVEECLPDKKKHLDFL